jgi:hypothetical protein
VEFSVKIVLKFRPGNVTLHSQLQEFNSKYRKGGLALLKIGIGILSLSNLVRISVNLLQEFKHIGYVEEWVIRVKSLSGVEMIPGFSLSPSNHVEHTVPFRFPPITVPIHLSIHKVLPLLVGGVHTVVKLVGIFNFAGGATGAVAVSGTGFIRVGTTPVGF